MNLRTERLNNRSMNLQLRPSPTICLASTRPPAFSVNCASLPSSLDGIRNRKARTGLVCQSSLIKLHPQNWTWPNLVHKASANQRLSRH